MTVTTLHGTTNNSGLHLSNFTAAVAHICQNLSSKRSSEVHSLSMYAFGQDISINVRYVSGKTSTLTMLDARNIFIEKGYDVLHTKMFQMLYDEDIINYW